MADGIYQRNPFIKTWNPEDEEKSAMDSLKYTPPEEGGDVPVTPESGVDPIEYYLSMLELRLSMGEYTPKQIKKYLQQYRDFIGTYGFTEQLPYYSDIMGNAGADVTQPKTFSDWLSLQKYMSEGQVEQDNSQSLNWLAVKNAADEARSGTLANALGADQQDTSLEDSQTWNEWRDRLLSELTGPEDWITKWEVANKQNPYQKQPLQNSGEQITYWQEKVDQLKPLVDSINQQLRDPNDKLTWDGIANPSNEQEMLASTVLKANKEASDKLFQMHSGEVLDTYNMSWMQDPEKAKETGWRFGFTPEGNPTGNFEQQLQNAAFNQYDMARNELANAKSATPWSLPTQTAPSGPAAPSWLPGFAQNQRTGQAITKENIATPSAQQLMNTPSSVLSGLKGYVNWSGGRTWEDVMGHAQSMLPNKARVAYNWTPARQR